MLVFIKYPDEPPIFPFASAGGFSVYTPLSKNRAIFRAVSVRNVWLRIKTRSWGLLLVFDDDTDDPKLFLMMIISM